MKWFRSKRNRDLRKAQLPLTSFGEVIYAVGDIHGRYDLLIDLVEQVFQDFIRLRKSSSFDLSARLIFLGDYVDRGPDSFKVIEYLSKLDLDGFTIAFLKGNHEQTLMDVLDRPTAFRNWLKHGGDVTVGSYGILVDVFSSDIELEEKRQEFCKIVPSEHKKFLNNLDINLHLPPLFFVHAGVDPKKKLEVQDEQSCLWIRKEFLESRKILPSIIVHGHTPQALPSWDERRIGLDTGAYITNKLVSAKIYGNNVEFIST